MALPAPMNILIVDDHQLVRDGLRAVLSTLRDADGNAPRITDVGGYQEAIAASDAARDLDLILLDLRLPDVAGFAALVDLHERHPAVPVIVMSGIDDSAIVREALDLGARGFVPKTSPSAIVLGAVRLVLSGGTYLPPEALNRATAPAPAHDLPPGGATGESLGLTPRQSEVLALLLRGKSNKMICRELDLSEGTVKNHVAAILRALDVTTRVQAVVVAAKKGIRF
jgi:DNA-binding NarL/FixJ family response regulator